MRHGETQDHEKHPTADYWYHTPPRSYLTPNYLSRMAGCQRLEQLHVLLRYCLFG